jgi:hypothetical protein
MGKRARGVGRMATEKLTLATLDAMDTEDLKVVMRAVRLVLALRGEGGKKKKK